MNIPLPVIFMLSIFGIAVIYWVIIILLDLKINKLI